MKKTGFSIIIEEDDGYEEVKAGVAADPKMRVTKMDRKSEIGQPIIFDVILDISGSMDDFYDELVNCFNEIMIPSLKEASKRYKGPMRLGCLLFSDELVPAWWGYKTLIELGPNPLKRSMLNQPGLKGRTALYGAMKAGILWTAAAMENMRDTGHGESPKSKIIVLTDGANNLHPLEESAVTKTLNNIGNENLESLQRVIGFFNTDDGLTESKFKKMAKDTNFEGLGFYDIAKGKDIKAKRASFRHHFQIFSSKASR
ncbi:MAG: vWA domain-containing protein [Parcubacteria group bacterium]